LDNKNNPYSEELLRLQIESMGETILNGKKDTTLIVSMLAQETSRFRNKIKEETGQIITVGDTRAALNALECYLNDCPMSLDLTPEQKALTQIWIDRLTLFKV